MGIVSGFRHTFNIGGSEIEVTTVDDVHSQADRVVGEVAIRGGEYEQRGQAIRLHLTEFWTETRTTGKTTTTVTVTKTAETVALSGEFAIQPRSEQFYPFEVKLPLNCRISTRSTGWYLQVEMVIPKAVDPKGKATLDVQPAEEFLAVVETCEAQLRFSELPKKRRWSSKTRVASFRLTPPEVLKAELDYLRLDMLLQPDGSVLVDLIFDLQEKSVSDYFKAMFGRDKVTRTITLSLAQVFVSEAEVNSAAISEALARSLQEVIESRR